MIAFYIALISLAVFAIVLALWDVLFERDDVEW